MKVKELIWREGDENMSICPPSKPAFVGVSEGTHIAVCNMIADMGMQETTFGTKHQVYLRFEVPGERSEWTDDEGKTHEGARNIGKTYNLTLNEKATLRQHLESWRGRTFTDAELMDGSGNPAYDVTKVGGLPCQLSVAKNDGGNSVIKSIIGLPKGMPVPKLESELIIYDDEHHDNLSKLPNWLQEAIKGKAEAPVQNESMGHASENIPFDDDIPF